VLIARFQAIDGHGELPTIIAHIPSRCICRRSDVKARCVKWCMLGSFDLGMGDLTLRALSPGRLCLTK
jgi:hypothetical protein